LAAEIRQGHFREDLYFRLNVIPIAVPRLRERQGDIMRLAEHFVAEFSREYGRRPKTFSPEARDLLETYHWPGNVRELRNTLERAVALSEPLAVGNAPPGAPGSSGGGTATAPIVDLSQPLRVGRQRVVDAWEREYVTRLLDECSGNVSEASRRAGLERMSMYRLLHRLGLR
jgi:DNA-binding NtrC family response regulator